MIAPPSGWCNACFRDVADIQLGKMLDKAKNHGAPTPYLRNVNVRWGRVDISDVLTMPMSDEERTKFSIEDGDVLVCEGGEPGRAAVWCSGPTNLKFQKALLRLRANTATCSYWLATYLRFSSQNGTLEASFSGTTIKHLPREALQAIALPLPPLAEQHRIIRKINSLSARSKRAHDHLNLVENLAQKYKEAILGAAFSGHITAHWRANNLSGTTANARLSQLRYKQNCIGAAKTRSDIEARKGTDSGRVALELNELPVEWGACTLEDATSPARLIQYGILKPGDHLPNGVPYVKVMNIKGGRIDQNSIRRTSPEIHYQYRRASIKENDILLTIRGTVGRLAFVPPELDGGNITQDSVRIEVLPQIERKFVFWFLHSPAARAYFAANMKGVAVRGINVGDVRLMEMPLPDRAEQNEIVSRIEEAFSWVDRLAAETTSARKLIDHLDQAILSKAFRGELVSQDPDDEPASVLLERIKTTKAVSLQPRRGRGSPRLATRA